MFGSFSQRVIKMNDWSKLYLSGRRFHKRLILSILLLAIGLIVLNFMLISEDKNPHYKSNEELEYEYASEMDDYDPSSFSILIKSKAWYLKNGIRYPESASISRHDTALLPFEKSDNDRILNQLMFIPPNYNPKNIKTILVNNGYPWWFGLKEEAQKMVGDPPPFWWKHQNSEDIFKDLKCPVDACRITDNKKERQSADLVFFLDSYEHTNETRPANQLYALHHMESAMKTNPFEYPDVFNWTITYRHDSIITTPYNKWVYYDPRIKQMEQSKNFAAHKTKKVAWFVSNCWPFNNRNQYAAELNQYIPVDIYGNCGTMHCPLSDEEKCYHILDDDYKFYLAFENANCKNYITEKFFTTGLGHDVIPIVMGSTPEDYEKYAPLRSFIHVDHFKSPKELAEYLHILDQNDDLYNSYFKWKGTGEFIPNWAYFWCRICALLHDDHTMSTKHWYKDINEWWRGPGICTKGSWRQA